MPSISPVVINGWSIFAYPLFLDQLDSLLSQVECLKRKYSDTYKQRNATERLAAINKLAFKVIPNDPTLLEYRQSNALGE